MSKHKMGVIGGGNMAEAIVGSAIRNGFLTPEQIVVGEPQQSRRKVLADKYAVTCRADNGEAVACEKILLAVKPQVMADLLADIADDIDDGKLVISIAAGLDTKFFDRHLTSGGRIVRVMPNTPMLVGQGASAVVAGPRCLADDIAWTKALFETGGLVVEVAENLIDAVIAVSGSGPAYFFYLIEAMTQAGIDEGLDGDIALELATQTCAGSAKLLATSGKSPAELRKRVTSPGGTTQRAIKIMEADGVKSSLIKAFHACAQRSRELGRQ